MSRELFDRCGWDPTEVHARLYGRKPGGIVVITQAERDRAEREAKARAEAEGEEAEREARARQRAEVEVKAAADDPHRNGEVADAPAADGGGSAPSAAPDRSHEDETPLHHPADGPPPRPGEDPDPETAERHRMLRAWISANWDTVLAMAREGIAPQVPVPSAPESCAATEPPPPVHVRKGDRWNKPKMVDFLRQLAATHSVSAAAKSVGMSRESAYRLRNRLKGRPFDIAWEAAFRQGYDNLAHAALDRAVNGVEVPHYCNGELVGTSRKYDERLTVAMLAMRNRYGAPLMGRYGAAAEWWSERWDAMLERVGTGAVDWSDEQRASDVPLDDEKHTAALIAKHAPEEGRVTPLRR